MVLNFLDSTYYFAYIPIGIVGLLLGFDRALKNEENESDKLKVIGAVSGIILIALTVLVSINEYDIGGDFITKYSILFGLILGMSLISRPFKELPLAFVIAVMVLIGTMYLFISNKDEINQFGAIPLKIILLGVLGLVFVVFIIGLIQEKAMDGLLFILGWGPIITVLGLALLVQGITLIIEFPDKDGVFSYLPG